MQLRALVLVAVLAVASVVPSHAAWLALDGSRSKSPALKSAGSVEQFSVEFGVPGLEIGRAEGYATVRIPGQPRVIEAGAPELPLLTTSILLPDRGNPEVKLVVVTEKTIDLTDKVIPGRGHLTRDIPLASVPLVEGAAYKADAWVPAQYGVQVDAPYIMRDVRGAAVRVSPVLYNPAKNQLRVLVKGRLEITVAKGAGVNEKTAARDGFDADFAPIYRSLFVNASALNQLGAPNENAGRAIVICQDDLVTNLQPLLDWRAQKGVETKLIKVSEIPGVSGVPTADQTKAAIAAEYAKGGLTYVLLVGDGDKLPPPKGVKEKADSDACFVKLEGDDHIPDAFISRFSANTAAEIDVQVARAIAYDKNPVTGDDAKFYAQATGIASAEGSPTDFERCEQLREALLAYHYSLVDKIYDPGANAATVADAVNAGRGLINYIGHGSKTMWVTSRFANSHVGQLTNGNGKWPMIWSVACVNGDFVRGTDCFGEAWAEAGTAADPRGAIGFVGASTNMAWVPPCDWQSAIIKEYMIKEQAWTGGAQHLMGLIKACEQWGTTATSQGVMMIEQCIYFGDASLQLRNDVPRQAAVTVQSVGNRQLAVKVTANDKPVKNARVVVRCSEGEAHVSVTDGDGLASLPFAPMGDNGDGGGDNPAPEHKITVTGPNLVPVLDQTLAMP